MSDEKHSSETERENSEKKPFIRETIQEKSRRRRISWKWILLVPVLAVVFGLIAGLTFVLSGNLFRDMLMTTEETRESVTIPMDSTPDQETTAAETTPAETTLSEDDREEALRETVEGMVEELVRGYLAREESKEESRDPACVLRVSEIAGQFRNNLVTVTSLQADEDVFNNSFVRSQNSFGVILAVTGEDIRIATESKLLTDAQGVRITFADGSTCEAELLQQDGTTGLAVVSVPLGSVAENLRGTLEPVVLGNSYFCHSGDMVVALGSPLDYVPSVAWGIVSYVRESVLGTDRNIRLLQTDIAANADAGGILVNTSGEVIGWITSKYNEDDQKELIAAVAVSDIKDLMEKLSNGIPIARLGVQVQTVTEEIAEQQNLPGGLYVVNSLDESPAYAAGIQNGDILVGIGGTELTRVEELRDELLVKKPGDEVELRVLRGGRDGYAEQTFTVTLGSR